MKKKALKNKTDTIVLTTEQCNEFVINTSRDVWNLIMSAARPIDKRQQFLLVGRVVSCIFANHFKLSIAVAENSVGPTK